MNPEERVRQMLAAARGEEEVTAAEWDAFAGSARRSVRVQRIVTAGIGLVLVAAVALGATTALDDKENQGLVTPIGTTEPDDARGCNDIDAPWRPDACNYDPNAPTPTPPSSPDGRNVGSLDQGEAEIWLVDDQTKTIWWGSRNVPFSGDPVASVIQALLEGPTGPDVEVGATSHIPEGTELLDTEIIGEVAHIDLSEEFAQGAGNPTSMRLREAQVVFTATQTEGVDEVRLFVEHEAYLGNTKPLGRDDFEDVAPPIVVETPKIGQQVTSPFIVSGTANVFEGTVSFDLDVHGPRGASITSFTTATCGSGCRGDFTEKVKFDDLDIDESVEATLTVYEESAEDGSRLNQIMIPLILQPPE
ncbi:MAG: GerMN domain-containing protein [Actinomycetota bacterium]|nr:GerMN domain-containing protein [Actinomycetota bacterium]